MNLSLCIAFVFGCVFTTRLFIVTRIWCVNDRRQSLTQCYVSETTPCVQQVWKPNSLLLTRAQLLMTTMKAMPTQLRRWCGMILNPLDAMVEMVDDFSEMRELVSGADYYS